MRRTIFVFAFLILFTILVAGIGEAKSSTPRFLINGKEVSVGEFTPMVINGETFLSIGEIEQILGLKITWDSSHNAFIIQNSTSTIIPSSALNSIPATMTVSTVATQGMILKLAADKAMPLELLWWKESDTTIVGPFNDYGYNVYYIYSAQPGMKFVTLVYRITNNWVESKDVPDIEGYIETDKGYYYNEWPGNSGNYKIATQEEINAFLGEYNGYESTLLPGCSTKGWITFEIPKDEKPVEIVIGAYARIILKGGF